MVCHSEGTMKITKGCFGYLEAQRKKEIIRTIFYFALSAAIFVMGYVTTGTKMNLLTVVAVCGCLPASKSMVSMIMYIIARARKGMILRGVSNACGFCHI